MSLLAAFRLKPEGFADRPIWKGPFTTSRGDKIYIIVFPRGNGIGKWTHVSVFLMTELATGHNDIYLPKITITVVASNSRDNILVCFRPRSMDQWVKSTQSFNNIATGLPCLARINSIKNDIFCNINGSVSIRVDIEECSDISGLPEGLSMINSETCLPLSVDIRQC